MTRIEILDIETQDKSDLGNISNFVNVFLISTLHRSAPFAIIPTLTNLMRSRTIPTVPILDSHVMQKTSCRLFLEVLSVLTTMTML